MFFKNVNYSLFIFLTTWLGLQHPFKEWITSESAEIQALLDGYVQLTLRHKRMNSKNDTWSGDERMI